MLKIRLQRIGRRNEPHYRMLVAEHTVGVKSNKFVEKVGTFNPRTKETQLKEERIKYWISVGAQPSGRVHNMLVKAKIIKGKAINVLPHKSPVIDEEKIAKEKEEAEAKAAAKKEAEEKAEADKLAAAEAAKAEADAPKEEVKEEVATDPVKSESEDSDHGADADDLTKIEGIGPKIAEVLNKNNITTFAQLADAKDEDTQEMIKEVKGNHQADTWNEQAALARDAKWDELKDLQEKLDGGVADTKEAAEAVEEVEK